MERKYMMYEGEEVNTIDLLFQQATTERNGLKVIIPVKRSDVNDFITKMKIQLAYFEDVIFQTESRISNDFKIYRSANYQVSELSTFTNMHLCLDNVYYPIDFDKLGIPRIDAPVGLRFSLTDGIFPTPNRESIRYTKEAKEKIIEKIKIVSDELINKYNDSLKNFKTPTELYTYYNTTSKTLKLMNISCRINELTKYSKVPLSEPMFEGISLLDLRVLAKMNQVYFIEEYEKFGKISYNKYTDVLPNNRKLYHFDEKAIILNERLSVLKREFLKEQISFYDTVYLVRKKRSYRLKNVTDTDISLFHILNLYLHPKHEWRQRIKEFFYFRSLVLEKWIDGDALEVTQEFIDSRKRARVSISNKRDKVSGQILCKEADKLERYMSNQYCKFSPITYDLSDIYKNPGLVIYGSYDDSSKFSDLYKIYSLSKKAKAHLLIMSNREKKIIDQVTNHNLMSIDQFMKGDNKPFRRFVTAYLIKQLVDKYDSVFNNLEPIRKISKTLYDKLVLLKEYQFNQLSYYESRSIKLLDSMLRIAKANNLFDGEVIHIYQETKSLLERLSFLNPMLSTMSRRNVDDDLLLPVLIDLFKYYKYRVNYDLYKIKIDEDTETLDLDTLFSFDSEEEDEEPGEEFTEESIVITTV